MTILVGIDPGINNIGVAIYDLDHPDDIFSCTCHSSSLQSIGERLSYVQGFFNGLKDSSYGLLDRVDYLVLERQPGKLNEIVAWATGVIIHILSPSDVIAINPCEMKKEITTDGWASKEDVRVALATVHKLDIANIDDHQVDAIGLIFSGINKHGL